MVVVNRTNPFPGMNPWMEEDLLIDLQPLVNRVHETGRFDKLDYGRFPDVPLTSSDREWLCACGAGARSED